MYFLIWTKIFIYIDILYCMYRCYFPGKLVVYCVGMCVCVWRCVYVKGILGKNILWWSCGVISKVSMLPALCTYMCTLYIPIYVLRLNLHLEKISVSAGTVAWDFFTCKNPDKILLWIKISFLKIQIFLNFMF